MLYSVKLKAEEFFMVKSGLTLTFYLFLKSDKILNGNLSAKGILADKFCYEIRKLFADGP